MIGREWHYPLLPSLYARLIVPEGRPRRSCVGASERLYGLQSEQEIARPLGRPCSEQRVGPPLGFQMADPFRSDERGYRVHLTILIRANWIATWFYLPFFRRYSRQTPVPLIHA